MNKRKALWIEDSALVDLDDMFGSVYACGRYDVLLAVDVTEAVRHLTENAFDAIVIDIRLPPGPSKEWIHLYNETGANKASARLGIALAYALLHPAKALVQLPRVPDWVSPARVGFLSVESRSEVLEDLHALGVTHYREKAVGNDPHALRDMLDGLVQNGKGIV